MMLLSEGDRNALQRKFTTDMKEDVTLLLFVDEESAISKELVDFVQLIAAFSPKIKVEVEKSDGGKNKRMRDLKIENTPCMLLVKDEFNRLRYYGVPSGYEMPPITDAIAELSNGVAKLSPTAKSALGTVRRRANIKVFVLQTCPFSPTVVRHAFRAAMGSPKVIAEIIDSSIFTDLAMKHSVVGVPKVILNDSVDITGAVQEAEFFKKLREADHALIDSMYG